MSSTKPAFSRPVPVASVSDEGTHTRVEANAEERAALAEADGLVAVHRLVGEFDLRLLKSGGSVAVRGLVSATITQICTVSLEPFESDMHEEVDLLFMSADRASAWANTRRAKAQSEPGLEDEDPPDAIVDGRIDLGAVAAEYLALGLDPYPRKPGVNFEPDVSGDEKDTSPFAALAKLRQEP